MIDNPELFLRNKKMDIKPALNYEDAFVLKKNEQSRKIHIKRLSSSMCEDDLRNYFSKFGEIDYTYIVLNVATKKSRCFGFLVFKDIIGYQKCLTIKDHVLNGQLIKVSPALEKSVIEQEKIKEGLDSAGLTTNDTSSTDGSHSGKGSGSNKKNNFNFSGFEEEIYNKNAKVINEMEMRKQFEENQQIYAGNAYGYNNNNLRYSDEDLLYEYYNNMNINYSYNQGSCYEEDYISKMYNPKMTTSNYNYMPTSPKSCGYEMPPSYPSYENYSRTNPHAKAHANAHMPPPQQYPTDFNHYNPKMAQTSPYCEC